MKRYPAVDVQSNDDVVYALIDEFEPTAIEERDNGLRAFFRSAGDRDAALASLVPRFSAAAIDVPDDDWARRSQADLQPIKVGLLTVFPNTQSLTPHPYAIVIEPSTGFGTGHHATTRLCLEALQAVDVNGKSVLDVGTGSGLLAIAADRLGAARVVGIDIDLDAIESARKNLAPNPPKSHVSFDVADIYVVSDTNSGDRATDRCQTPDLPHWCQTPVDVVVANLTGAMLVRIADGLLQRTKPGGILIVSGLLQHEKDDVRAAFTTASVIWERAEDEWIGLAMKKP